ncbi:MAG: hypothetical protein EAZ89_15900 [Bacteroidetes bacterium]|nr:MAG: hypothetical protein EAZ89_15900 [Bacteroidota bacterium]
MPVYMKRVLCFWFCMASLWAFTQDRQQVDQLNESALHYQSSHELEQARSASGQALEMARRIGYPEGEITALLGLVYPLYFTDSIREALPVVQEALALAQKQRLSLAEAQCHLTLGNFLLSAGDISGSRASYRRAYEGYTQLGQSLKSSSALGGLSDTYLREARYFEALDTLLLCYRITTQARDTFRMARVAYSISGVYKNLPEYGEQALDFTRQAVMLARYSGNEALHCLCVSNMGQIYADQPEPDSARAYLLQAKEMCTQVGRGDLVITACLGLATLEKKTGNHRAERDWLQEALGYTQPDDSGGYEDAISIEVLIALGNCFLALGDLSQAEHYLQLSLPSYERSSAYGLGVALFRGLGELAELRQRPTEALRYYRRSVALRDSIFFDENAQKLARMVYTHEFEQKQALAQAARDKELALRDARTRQQRWLYGLSLLFLSGGGAAYVYVYRRQQEQQRTLLELANLRAQMNPHFIFNCLNSIYRYTKEGNTETASYYLQKFSRLLRLVLENSRSEKITLARDLDALKLYVEIEALRFKDKLRFHVRMDPAIDPGFVQVPGMLIQPHVENAIWHGLMHKDEGGEIELALTQPQEQILRVEIRDNGIGRSASAELRTQNAHKSIGSQITEDRIRMAGKMARGGAKTQITDLYDEQGQATGTLVVLEIPI